MGVCVCDVRDVCGVCACVDVFCTCVHAQAAHQRPSL